MAVVVYALGVALSAAGLGSAIVQTPVAAAMNCASNSNCNWTQADYQTDWPNNTSDPNCYNQCERWNLDCRYREEYLNDWTDGSVWQHDADWAQSTWDSVQECTPTFNKAPSSSSAWLTQVGAQSLPGNPPPCGVWQPQGYQSGSNVFLTGGSVFINSSARFTDSVSPGVCNIRNTFLHETGHMYGEGHSSVRTDVMYLNTDQGNTAIDADAHSELAAVYGMPQPSNCNSCQFDLWTGPITLVPMGPSDYQQMLAAKALAVVQAAQATKDAAWMSVPKPSLCSSICDPPPGGP